MSRIEVEHQGFTIIYGENSDRWECYALDLEAATLSKLKTKINQHVKNVIKTADLVFGHRQGGYGKPQRVQLISRDTATAKFWVTTVDGRRQLAKPQDLTPWGDEVNDKMTEIAAINKQIAELHRKVDALEKGIRPLSTEEIDKLLAEIAKRVAVDE